MKLHWEGVTAALKSLRGRLLGALLSVHFSLRHSVLSLPYSVFHFWLGCTVSPSLNHPLTHLKYQKIKKGFFLARPLSKTLQDFDWSLVGTARSMKLTLSTSAVSWDQDIIEFNGIMTGQNTRNLEQYVCLQSGTCDSQHLPLKVRTNLAWASLGSFCISLWRSQSLLAPAMTVHA